ncbi:hypothetical protein C8R43DRAFT_941779 [Mycena crocata]|nr:hypothetical protein C8R43DRAFT_941779 [Mycena crocata]
MRIWMRVVQYGVTHPILRSTMMDNEWWTRGNLPGSDYYPLFSDLKDNDKAGRWDRLEMIEARRAEMISTLGARFVSMTLRPSAELERAARLDGEPVPDEVPAELLEATREMFYASNLEVHEPVQRWIKGWIPTVQATATSLRNTVDRLRLELLTAEIDSVLVEEIMRDHQAIVAPQKNMPKEVLSLILLDAIAEPDKDPISVTHGGIASSRIPTFGPTCSFPPQPGPTAMCGPGTFRTTPTSPTHKSGGKSPPEMDKVWVEGTVVRLQRSGALPLDVVVAADRRVPVRMMELLVEVSNRWGTFWLRSPKNVCSDPAGLVPTSPTEMRLEHMWFPLLAKIWGNLSNLQRLTLEGHDFRGRWRAVPSTALWQGSTVEERDIISWFEDAPALNEVVLLGIFLPEQTLLLPWGQITKYTEQDTRRKVPMPLSHLRRMSNVQEIYWRDCWLTADKTDNATLPLLTSMCWTLHRQPHALETNLELYDRLLPLRLPALTDLYLDGNGFNNLQGRDHAILPDIPIHATIMSLLERSGRLTGLISLKLALSTAISEEGVVVLLTQIPTLESFWLEEDPLDDFCGIMNVDLLHSLKAVVVTVDFLKIEGARGLPMDVEDMGVLRDVSWLRKLLDMLDHQFAHNLTTLDLLGGNNSPWTCPFDTDSHKVIERRLQTHFAEGKRLVVHGPGLGCLNGGLTGSMSSQMEAAAEEGGDDGEKSGDGDEELDNAAYEEGVSVFGASDEDDV